MSTLIGQWVYIALGSYENLRVSESTVDSQTFENLRANITLRKKILVLRFSNLENLRARNILSKYLFANFALRFSAI
jgi:hypothetical protein